MDRRTDLGWASAVIEKARRNRKVIRKNKPTGITLLLNIFRALLSFHQFSRNNSFSNKFSWTPTIPGPGGRGRRIVWAGLCNFPGAEKSGIRFGIEYFVELDPFNLLDDHVHSGKGRVLTRE